MNQEENKNAENTQSTGYQIPGVIIPDQVTDSGVHISQTNTELPNTTSEESASKEPEKNQGDVYQIPGVIIPAQTTDNGTISEVNNVTEENVYKEPEKEKINTDEKPLMPGMMPEKKVEEVKVEAPKKVKKEGNSKIGCLHLIIIALGVVILFLAYKAFFKPSIVITEDAKTINKSIYDKNSLIVQELYSWVNLSSCNNMNYSLFDGQKESISSTDLSNEFKLYMAYLQVKRKDTSEEKCVNYINATHSKDQEKKWYCGSDYLNSKTDNYNDKNDKTYVIDAKVLQNQVEKMFGAGEYKKSNFYINIDSRFYYDSSNEKYILQTTSQEVSCNNFKVKLIGVTNNINEISLSLRITHADKYTMNKNVYFKKTNDGNYYFDRVTN